MAPPVSIELHLDGHCIETAAKREFRRLVDACLLATDPDPELEARIAVVRDFIETADFPRLRGGDLPLDGTSPVLVRIISENETFRIDIDRAH